MWTVGEDNSSKNISSCNVGVSSIAYDYVQTRANAVTIYYWQLTNQSSKSFISSGVYEVSNCVTMWDEKLHSGNPFECP